MNFKADEIIQAVDAIEYEKRPMAKMAVISKYITPTVELFLNIKYHELIKACPVPRFNMQEATDEEILTVVKDILSSGIISQKTFYSLPFKAQQVLRYMSDRYSLGLSKPQILSIVPMIHTIPNLYKLLDITIEPVMDEKCPKCGVHHSGLCDSCITDIVKTTEYRSESFTLYGISRSDFEYTFRDWNLVVKDNVFTFTRLNESIETYEPKLPFEEYQDNLTIIK